MGKTRTTRKVRIPRATSTPQRAIDYSLVDEDASAAAAESSPAPAGCNDRPLLSKGMLHASLLIDYETPFRAL